MKAETFSAALGEIDHRYLAEAEACLPPKRVIPWKALCCAAACLALIVSVLLPNSGGTPGVRLGDTVLTGQPVPVAPAARSVMLAMVNPSLDVTLEITAPKGTVITAEVGELRLLDPETGEVTGSGTAVPLPGDCVVCWRIAAADPGETYMAVIGEGARSRRLTLQYDSETQIWMISCE